MEYTEKNQVVTDKKTRIYPFFVHHELHSKFLIFALKYGDHTFMLTLQSLNTRLTFIKSFTHHEASVGFLKYVSTGRTVQNTLKERLISALMNVNLTEKDIIALQQNTENNINTKNSNKRKIDDQIKDATEGNNPNIPNQSIPPPPIK